MEEKIGIIGLGMVGGVIYRWFKEKKYQVFGYDKFKKVGTLKEVEGAKIIFLCLPTPYDKEKGYDLSSLIENLEYFKNKDSKIFVIKSTVLPGTTDYFQKKYKRHYFLFSPEFLSEATAEKDFRKPFLQVVGYTQKTKKLAQKILKILPKAKILNIITEAKAAEIFKLVRNAFFSTKVIFSNIVFDLCQKLDVDYEEVKMLMKTDPWIGGIHFEIFHKGKRGFGGKCLPKDLLALIWCYKKLKLKPKLFEVVWKENFNLLKKQKLLKKLFRDWLQNKS